MKIATIIGYLFFVISLNAQVHYSKQFESVNDYCFSADGKLLILTNSQTIEVYETTNYKLLHSLKHENDAPIRFVAISNSKGYVASSRKDGTTILWDLNTSKIQESFKSPNLITTLKFSPKDNYLAVGTSEKVIILQTETFEPIHTLKGHSDYVTDLKFYDNETLFSCSADGSIIIWNIPTQRSTVKWKAGKNWIRGIALNEDKTNLISCGDDGRVKIWDIKDFNKIKKIKSRKQSFDWIMTCDYFTNDIYAVGGHNKRINIIAPQIKYKLNLKSYVNKLLFKPMTKSLIVAALTQDSKLRIINARDMKVDK